MRKALLIVLLAACGARSFAAEPTTRPSEIEPWCQKNIVEAYEQGGAHDPRWDDDAREILAAMARMWSREQTRTQDEEDLIWFAARRIDEADCDDPLVLYARARNLDYWNRPADQIIEAHADAADLMRDSGYHPVFKFYALARAAQMRARATNVPGAQEEARELLDEAFELLPRIAVDQEISRRRFADILDILNDVGEVVEGDFAPAMLKGLEIFDAHCPNRSTNLALRAHFLVQYAWQARGSGYANTVTEEGRRLMRERLAQAAEAIEEAWKLDPTNHQAASTMLEVELGQGQGIKRLLTWFRRAAETDPTAYGPYSRVLYYLEPKWYGNPRTLIGFGKAAMRMGNWEAPGTYALVDAHLTLSKYHGEKVQGRPQREYFLNNEQAWEDIQSFYEEYLRRVPESLYYRTEYAKLAAWCGKWEQAERQFQLMGDRFSYSALRGHGKLREEIKAHLNPDPPADGAAPTTRPE